MNKMKVIWQIPKNELKKQKKNISTASLFLKQPRKYLKTLLLVNYKENIKIM